MWRRPEKQLWSEACEKRNRHESASLPRAPTPWQRQGSERTRKKEERKFVRHMTPALSNVTLKECQLLLACATDASAVKVFLTDAFGSWSCLRIHPFFMCAVPDRQVQIKPLQWSTGSEGRDVIYPRSVWAFIMWHYPCLGLSLKQLHIENISWVTIYIYTYMDDIRR